MKTIALLPVRNEEWVLRQSLSCLSAFCDVIIVSDQQSEDRSREICGEFPKVQVIESPASFICEQARWRLWDAAREYDGHNLIWCTDADELVPPAAARAFIAAQGDALTPGTVVECHYYHLWGATDRYRSSVPPYTPYWKPVAVIDDRRMDYDRSRALPLHEERVPIPADAPRVRAAQVPVLHLQWLLMTRNQTKQCWYRCRELIGGKTAAVINRDYAQTIPSPNVATTAVPPEWLDGLTFPDLSIDDEPAWQEREILGWFDVHGIEYFEPLEIWHVPRLRAEFLRRTGRQPRPDLSYRPSWMARARGLTRRVAGGVRRRLLG